MNDENNMMVKNMIELADRLKQALSVDDQCGSINVRLGYVSEDQRALIVTSLRSHATLKARIEELTSVLDEILNYKGGANSALEDEYVMDRALLASKGGAK